MIHWVTRNLCLFLSLEEAVVDQQQGNPPSDKSGGQCWLENPQMGKRPSGLCQTGLRSKGEGRLPGMREEVGRQDKHSVGISGDVPNSIWKRPQALWKVLPSQVSRCCRRDTGEAATSFPALQFGRTRFHCRVWNVFSREKRHPLEG